MKDLRIPEKKFRPELEGVRAVAALLVAIYHIWFGTVSGGVDVFFIVSGYLITTSLVTRIEREGKINFPEYVLGLWRRLFPNAFIVMFSIVILSFLLLPSVQWNQIMAEIYASMFYFQNWELATNAVDYLAQNNEATPLQHFWALSIQGQFYILWPVLIFIIFIMVRKVLKTPFRKTLVAALGGIFLTSLIYSIYITNVNQPWAYFDTFARMWEFSLGGILALFIPYLTPKKWYSTVGGWIGLVIIVTTGMVLPVSTVFPGYAALLPISGVILVIVSAEKYSKYSVKKLLGSRPLMYIGSISYAFYLWHWPLLIFYYALFNTDSVTFFNGLIILLITFILSILSTKKVESPVRKISVKHSKVKLLSTLVVFLIPVLTLNIFWGIFEQQTQEMFKHQVERENYPGAKVIYDNAEAQQDVPPIATPPKANSKLPTFYEDDCYVGMNEAGLKLCSYGETENPEFTIALVGGSHSGHWFPALEQFAQDSGVKIDVYNKDACRFSTQDFDGLLSATCMEWNERIIEPLMDNPPDLIVTTASVNAGAKVPQGYIEMWKKFQGIANIFAIRDNPRMKEDVPSCVELNGPEECSVQRKEALSEKAPWENTTNIPNNVYFADLSDYFCVGDTCPAVIGNVLVYRDQHHISTLYSMTLAEPLKEHIFEALETFKK
ncbi:putative peptidoglycan O-acetyltransferase YrhL [Lentibacillus sp. JNUCC-1]|uniref:acyltransferase family protein n=1 Tax=Lentibacillus sp. JNUCC-1 TaxID=2654513 RepID=UPI0012E7F170|nr:acyltransferase family protein [Lentibacillus sp. JNUCC-1]MUV37316.1 putative peptidoglycan O-acetyltransferase YrhL [Lentibacillus sp. JNUCC-1]